MFLTAFVAVSFVLSASGFSSAGVATPLSPIDLQADAVLYGVDDLFASPPVGLDSEILIPSMPLSVENPQIDADLEAPVDDSTFQPEEVVEAKPVPEPTSLGLVALGGLLSIMAAARYRLG